MRALPPVSVPLKDPPSALSTGTSERSDTGIDAAGGWLVFPNVVPNVTACAASPGLDGVVILTLNVAEAPGAMSLLPETAVPTLWKRAPVRVKWSGPEYGAPVASKTTRVQVPTWGSCTSSSPKPPPAPCGRDWETIRPSGSMSVTLIVWPPGATSLPSQATRDTRRSVPAGTVNGTVWTS